MFRPTERTSVRENALLFGDHKHVLTCRNRLLWRDRGPTHLDCANATTQSPLVTQVDTDAIATKAVDASPSKSHSNSTMRGDGLEYGAVTRVHFGNLRPCCFEKPRKV
jgi:hypothetical protein